MNNRLFTQAVWTVRKERSKSRPGKKDLVEAAKRYLAAGKNKQRLSDLIKGMK